LKILLPPSEAELKFLCHNHASDEPSVYEYSPHFAGELAGPSIGQIPEILAPDKSWRRFESQHGNTGPVCLAWIAIGWVRDQ
jgi:hypothetical protein